MAETSDTVKLSVRLLVDEEKNKVVLAETGKDFVDVLFSFLTLPMGTIVRLLEKHRKSPQVVVGCFNNLYKSVSDMGLESFQTESCKQVLLYPRSVNHDKYRRIKLKIDDTEAVNYFVCSRFYFSESCKRFYSILNTEECVCGEYVNSNFVGRLMNEERIMRNDSDEIFVSSDTSFIITNDLKVASSSMDYVLNTLRSIGYGNAFKLGEILLDVGFSEVLTLLECLFTSDSPLTDTFLRKQSSLRMTRSRIPLISTVQGSKDGAEPDQTITLKAFVRKMDRKVLCVECGSDFVDFLFTFLALPLDSVWEFSGDNITLGCIGNLFRSFKSFNEESTEDSSSSKCLLPSYYSCPKQLLDVVTEQQEIYYSFNRYDCGVTSAHKFTRKMPDCLSSQSESNLDIYQTHKTAGASVLYMRSFGFVRRNTRFLVTDDLVIKPKDSVSNISLLKLQMHLEEKDVDEQVITIGRLEAMSLLRASMMMTSSALTTCFWNLIAKKAKEET